MGEACSDLKRISGNQLRKEEVADYYPKTEIGIAE